MHWISVNVWLAIASYKHSASGRSLKLVFGPGLTSCIVLPSSEEVDNGPCYCIASESIVRGI